MDEKCCYVFRDGRICEGPISKGKYCYYCSHKSGLEYGHLREEQLLEMANEWLKIGYSLETSHEGFLISSAIRKFGYRLNWCKSTMIHKDPET